MAAESQRKTYSEIMNTFVLFCLIFAINFWYVEIPVLTEIEIFVIFFLQFLLKEFKQNSMN